MSNTRQLVMGGRPDRHPYELFLQFAEVEHRTLFDEHFRVQGRKKWYETIEAMQTDLDAYLVVYNNKRPHPGRAMTSKTPKRVFKDGLPKREIAKIKPTTKAT